ncbi:MAG TPA: SDR family NAD(P)-dependent oxidoreductase [Chitinophagaceae bacterium]|jgi:NAD(P)-dependent dehydrogenase (short-subunit alcohol dehydrogenase family)|nr:SDR family NAD(P)-dependent oxidoreductase [Chitinophagaceae bacterium]
MANIFLTGGAGNLGTVVVDTLIEAGHSLHLTLFSEADKTHEKASRYLTDLTHQDAVENTIDSILDKAHKIDAGVFLAGGYTSGGIDAVDMEAIHKMIKLNFETVFYASQKLISHFKTNGGGCLIFTGAKAAMENATAAANVAYALSKQMLFNYCNMINEQENKNKVSAHILLPNTLDTVLNRSLMPNADFSKWTHPVDIGQIINRIVEGKETNAVIRF